MSLVLSRSEGRMMVWPFSFHRGAAKMMAADLKDTPAAGLATRLCGDADLSNFGVFAAPERRVLFALIDFDETLPRGVDMRNWRNRPRTGLDDMNIAVRDRQTEPTAGSVPK